MKPDVTLLGVGWSQDELTLGGLKALQSAGQIVLQTERLGCAQYLREQGIAFDTLDALYEQAEDFDEFAGQAVAHLAERAASAPLLYAASELNDRVASMLAQRFPVRLIPGVAAGGALNAFAGSGVRVVSAIDYEDFVPQVTVPTLVRELDSPQYASEMKLKLMNCYPEESGILLCGADGEVRSARLCDLDRQKAYDHRLCALIPAVDDLTQLERFDFDALMRIVRRLRSPEGCPWDREQTHESLRASVIEEAYEVVEAIDQQDTDALYDELGDVLLIVALQAQIGSEHGEFDITDSTTSICRKMIRRHPHVFANAALDDLSAEWERIKREEKGETTAVDAMRDVARALPALTRARKVLAKAARGGLCPQDAQLAQAQAQDALQELVKAMQNGEELAEKAGETLMKLVNLLRIGNTDPEMILSDQIDRAIERFAAMEERNAE